MATVCSVRCNGGNQPADFVGWGLFTQAGWSSGAATTSSLSFSGWRGDRDVVPVDAVLGTRLG